MSAALSETDSDAHEALLQFLYMAPVGLVQVAPGGAVELMNPMAASLLMALAPSATLDNLFEALAVAAPGLQDRVDAFSGAFGSVCEPLRIAVPTSAGPGSSRSRTMSLALFKLDQSRLMAMLRDATDEVARETKQLKAASHLDTLTEMPNRAAVLALIDAGLRLAPSATQRHCAVLFLNIDRFKQINDSLGYAAGDEVLTLLSNRDPSDHDVGVVRTRDGEARDPSVRPARR